MQICGIEFTEAETNGKYCLTAVAMPTIEIFKEINKIAKAHGGVYIRPMSFIFNEKPDFDAEVTEAPVQEPKAEEKPATKVLHLQTKAKREAEAKKKAETEKKATKKTERKTTKPNTEKKGVEFEIYPPETIEKCAEHIEVLKDKFKDSADHYVALRLLLEACTEDEELRSYLTHKDYEKMLNEGAQAWAKEKEIKGNMVYCSISQVSELMPFVITAYKKPVVKQLSKKGEE